MRFIGIKQLLLAGFISFALGGPALATELRVAVPAAPGSIDPICWASASDLWLIDNLLPRLLKPVPGDTWKYELSAAKSLDTSDPKNIKFELKPGMMWSNGFGEVTADDVKYSYERFLNPDVATCGLTDFEIVDNVEITGTYTGIIHLKWPGAGFIGATLSTATGAIVSKKAVESVGGSFTDMPPATSGPYRVKSFTSGETMVLERDPDWTGTPGKIDEISIIPVPDANAQEIAFRAGEIDYALLAINQLGALEANMPEGGAVKVVHTADYSFLSLNTEHPNLKDPRVRKAIRLALDVPAIVAPDEPATGFSAVGVVGHIDSAIPPRDVAAAKALIEEAGATGQSVKLSFPNDSATLVWAQIIQSNLAEIGLQVEIDQLDEGAFWDITARPSEERQMDIQTWAGNPETYYVLQYFAEKEKGTWNWSNFSNKDFEALLEKVKDTFDPAERGKIYQQMQQILADNGAVIYLTNPSYPILYRTNVKPGMLPSGEPVFSAFEPVQ